MVVDDTDGDLLYSLTDKDFDGLRAVLSSGRKVLWLTRGVKQGQCPGGGTAEGLLRVIRSEQAAAKIVLLDFSNGESHFDVAQVIISKLYHANTNASGDDTEFWLHQGTLHIPRLFSNVALNSQWNGTAQASNVQKKSLAKDLMLKATIIDSGVVFEEEVGLATLMEDEIEMQVDVSGLQHNLGSNTLVSGTVIRGKACHRF